MNFDAMTLDLQPLSRGLGDAMPFT